MISKRFSTFVALLVCCVGSAAVFGDAFNGAADNQTDQYGYYYAVGGGLFPNWIGLMQALMGAAIALTYPLGLIFVLNSRSVRQFYAPPEPPAV